MAFGIDLPGRIGNIRLAKADCLHPLFEAVVNSIQEIGEVKRIHKDTGGGRVTIRIERDNSQKMMSESGSPFNSRPIIGFTVEDDGLGFTEENYRSFERSDTRRKAMKGGKGVGRFLWLKAFDRVHVESTYSEKGVWFKRSFDFTCTEAGIENPNIIPTKEQRRRTTIRLLGLKTPYCDVCPKSSRAISKQIIEHCMPFFVLGDCPQIVVHDPDDDNDTLLADVFDNEIKISQENSSFSVNGRLFRITHLLTRSTEDAEHRLYYCAHNRSVRHDSLKPKIANLHKGLISAEHQKPIYYTGLISGDYLDDRVSPERTRFEIEDDIFSGGADTMQWKELVQEGVACAKTFLSAYLAPIQRRKEEQIENLVRTRSPRYRTMVRSRPELTEEIPPDLDDDQLEVKLSEQFVYFESKLRSQAELMLAENEQGYEEIRKHFGQFIEKWNDQGVSKLAQYVIHRKSTLELFARKLKIRDDNKYSLEAAIHKLIFPMRATSDDVPYESMNLWMIDERLSYHSYLASDKNMNQFENCDIESDDRADLVIFNSPFAFTDTDRDYNSVVIIEFKRPMRDNFKPSSNDTEDEQAKKNPITQVLRYIERIREGTAIDREGRPIIIGEGARFFAYIICDLTSSIKQLAKEYDMEKTPDQKGYFKPFSNYNAYMEIISFDQLLDNATKRNKMFFDKLNIPDRRS